MNIFNRTKDKPKRKYTRKPKTSFLGEDYLIALEEIEKQPPVIRKYMREILNKKRRN